MKKSSQIWGKKIAIGLLLLVIAIMLMTLVSRWYRAPTMDIRPIPLPDISQQPLHLRAVYARNPRFEDITTVQMQRILQESALLAKQHYGVDITFEITPSIFVDELFARLPKQVRSERRQEIVDVQHISNKDMKQMQNDLYHKLSGFKGDSSNLIEYARPYLLTEQMVTDVDGLSQALVTTHLARLSFWYQEKALDKQPVIDANPFNQWVWWDALGYGNIPYDVVITNQLVASAEMDGLEMHSSLRGGITGGTTSYSKQGRYGGYVFVSVFALITNNEMLSQLRDDVQYSDEQVVHYAAATLAHELGHLFFHFDHPFGDNSCLMNPTPLLRYREWYDGLNAEACRVRNLPQTQPGAANIGYNTHW